MFLKKFSFGLEDVPGVTEDGQGGFEELQGDLTH